VGGEGDANYASGVVSPSTCASFCSFLHPVEGFVDAYREQWNPVADDAILLFCT